MPKPPVNTREFNSLVEVVQSLRGPEGCPWDKEQTHHTLTQYAIEEVHELAEAIDRNNNAEMTEELGDLLLQVLLHAEIGRQEARFTLEDIIQGITEKLIRRHPHVFGEVSVKNSAEVLSNWAKIKDQEKASEANKIKNPFHSIPVSLPALIRAQKIGSKTVRYNFDWSKASEVLAKVEEELGELKEVIAQNKSSLQQEELGDLLFSVVQLARHLNIDAEQSLRITNKKFENRFLKMRELVESEMKDFTQLPVTELEKYWRRAKAIEKSEQTQT